MGNTQKGAAPLKTDLLMENSQGAHLLQQYGFRIHSEHDSLRKQIRDRFISLSRHDRKKAADELKKNYKKLEHSLNIYIKKQNDLVKLSALIWLSFECSIKDESEKSIEHAWMVLDVDYKNKCSVLVDASYFPQEDLNTRIKHALFSLPTQTLTAIEFCSFLYEKALHEKNTYATKRRFELFCSEYIKKDYSYSKQRNIDLIFFLSNCNKILFQGHEIKHDQITILVSLMDQFWGSTKRWRNYFFNHLNDWQEIIILDHKELSTYKNLNHLRSAAAKVLHMEPAEISQRMDIAEKIDLLHGYSFESLSSRKKVYKEISRIYTKSSTSLLPQDKPKAVSLTIDELDCIAKLQHSSKPSTPELIKECLQHALKQYKESPNDTKTQQLSAKMRKNIKRTSIRLDMDSKRLLKDLLTAINKSKNPLPRKLSDSLAIGIAIRLYAESKSHREISYRGATYTYSGERDRRFRGIIQNWSR